jgi:hypothetical protein
VAPRGDAHASACACAAQASTASDEEWQAAEYGVEDDDVQHPEEYVPDHGSVMMMKVMSAPTSPTRAQK